jgi:two-component system, sensor histidine kinase and response regulator
MLDLRTLVIALIITFTLQAVLFLLMTLFISAYKGLRLWSIGCLLLAINFISIYLRGVHFHTEWMILVSNVASIAALLCFYYGTKKFLKLPIKLIPALIWSVIYVSTISYFIFVDDRLNIRIIFFSIMMGIILLRNAQILIAHRSDTFKSSALILSGLFILIGLLLLCRAVYTIAYPISSNDFFNNNIMQSATMLFSLCLGVVWTQGVILLVNQKLHGDLEIKTEELEATNQEKDKFFSILAHDLRGPLTTIMGLVDLMADEKSELGEKLMQEMALAMKKTVHSTNILLDNLLDWASLQRGLKSFVLEHTTYGELMSTVMPPLHIQAAGKNITIIDEIPETTPMTADSKMIQSVFRNLLANAIKFTPVNGTIRLVSSMSNDGKIVFSVMDSGIGIDTNLKENLFNIGLHNMRKGTSGENSTGLGLMICKEFVDKHGGQIWVESEVGKGSTFSFCLEPKTQNTSKAM